jgi:hypothetical protein
MSSEIPTYNVKESVSLVPGIFPGMLTRRLRLQNWRERRTLNTRFSFGKYGSAFVGRVEEGNPTNDPIL